MAVHLPRPMILATHEVFGSLPPILTPIVQTHLDRNYSHVRRKPSMYHPSKGLYSISTKPLRHPLSDQTVTTRRLVFCVSSSASRGRMYDRKSWCAWGAGATLALAVPGAGCGIGIHARVLITRFCGPLWMFGKPRLPGLARSKNFDYHPRRLG